VLVRWVQAVATASRHVCIADALKARCVLAEVRWRWTLKVFWVAACAERNLESGKNSGVTGKRKP
jgi:hypothetical protein